ncbi:MAG TPA: MGMT family protein [Steroidobacteraceae bacterium]|nr:MGMT family protein [Steroidobacteraceae bacterium]
MKRRALPPNALERIYAAIRAVPRGRVATYGLIAERAGLPRRARLVGHALRHAPRRLRLPWHRIINAQGRISFPRGSEPYVEQRRRLEAEGVRFVRGRVKLAQFGWQLTLDELLWKLPG